jgi:uncharacterized hydrophobic protein (TIGR00271 family)
VLALRVIASPDELAAAARALRDVPGVGRAIRTPTDDPAVSVLWADVPTDAADDVLHALSQAGVARDSTLLARLDVVGPLARGAGAAGRPEGFAWVQVLGEARAQARPIGRYLALMAVAGVIAALGVINRNAILIVGAMAVSPDLLPLCALCVGIIGRRVRLARQAFATLAVGLAVTAGMAAVLSAGLDVASALPDDFAVGEGGLGTLSTVDESTVIVALAAGVAAMLAFETRAAAAVGVAISVTTIPASAYLGVAFGVGEADKAVGALGVLGVNVLSLAVAGSLTLALQRRLAHRGGLASADTT